MLIFVVKVSDKNILTTKISRSMVVCHFQCARSWYGCHTKYSIFHLVFSKWYPTHLFSL